MNGLKSNDDPAGCRAAPAPSLRVNTAWALAANILFAACQWGLLIALARLGGQTAVGQFALGLAIATPVITLTNLQLRSVQATDAENRYRFAEYVGLRRKTSLLALAAIAGIALASGSRLPTALVIISVGWAKAVESLSDIQYGLFQKREAVSLIARSMALRGLLGLAAPVVVLYFTTSTAAAVSALVVAWGLVLVLFDIRRGGGLLSSSAHPNDALARKAAVRRRGWIDLLVPPRQIDLARAAFPLGLVTALISLQMNVPRYFVQWRGGESALGVFSAIAYLGTLLTVFIDALGLAVTPRLAKLFALGKFGDLRRLLARLMTLGGLAGIAAVAVAAGCGDLILRVAYGSAYASHTFLFVLLMLAAGIGCMGTLLGCALTAGGWFAPQVWIYGAVVAAAIVSCALLTPRYGAVGAAMAMSVSAALQVTLSAILVSRMLVQSEPVLTARDSSLPASPGLSELPLRSRYS